MGYYIYLQPQYQPAPSPCFLTFHLYGSSAGGSYGGSLGSPSISAPLSPCSSYPVVCAWSSCPLFRPSISCVGVQGSSLIASGGRVMGTGSWGGGTGFLPRRIRYIITSAIKPIPTTAAATPIPALAPVDRPDEAALASGNEVSVDVLDGVDDAGEGSEVAGVEGDVFGLPIFHPITPDALIVVSSFTTRLLIAHDLTSSLGVDAYVKVAPDVTVDAQSPTTNPDFESSR